MGVCGYIVRKLNQCENVQVLDVNTQLRLHKFHQGNLTVDFAAGF
jgi:hypothetical protein